MRKKLSLNQSLFLLTFTCLFFVQFQLHHCQVADFPPKHGYNYLVSIDIFHYFCSSHNYTEIMYLPKAWYTLASYVNKNILVHS